MVFALTLVPTRNPNFHETNQETMEHFHDFCLSIIACCGPLRTSCLPILGMCSMLTSS